MGLQKKVSRSPNISTIEFGNACNLAIRHHRAVYSGGPCECFWHIRAQEEAEIIKKKKKTKKLYKLLEVHHHYNQLVNGE